MPKLVSLYIRNVAIGFALAAVFTSLLLWLDVANLRHLIFNVAEGPIALFILFMFNGIVFSGVQFGIAIMRLENNEPRGGKPLRQSVKPIPLSIENIR